jgi:hypothetical protein
MGARGTTPQDKRDRGFKSGSLFFFKGTFFKTFLRSIWMIEIDNLPVEVSFAAHESSLSGYLFGCLCLTDREWQRNVC